MAVSVFKNNFKKVKPEMVRETLSDIQIGKSFEVISCGISLIVFKFSVISSPSFPSPLDKPVTNLPSLYNKDADIPSILGSALYVSL